ncbi:thioredoxin [Candidatus Roizmanbacteria bacterium RIFCSPLOWO2_02_FULL_43_10]|uniref:Thioredoxin n=1 Tax=Candidatus Roizmanbacteria bacterium RIFCSPLOWO2_02_FULL_43_10 TaxID=1802078 RepID=A0A1F7JVU6_9BACT|nr:MAG: thioredoxin [Candidatus Roizmanbacteria bacterium RIFCSPLOWO2_02_FULL_43_10]
MTQQSQITHTVLPVTTETFDEEVLRHDGAVFVDFYADWCGPCKMTSPLIEDLAQDPKYKSVKFVQVDVDSSQELALRYSIFSIPTFMGFRKGDVVMQFAGARDRMWFESELQRLMA